MHLIIKRETKAGIYIVEIDGRTKTEALKKVKEILREKEKR